MRTLNPLCSLEDNNIAWFFGGELRQTSSCLGGFLLSPGYKLSPGEPKKPWNGIGMVCLGSCRNSKNVRISFLHHEFTQMAHFYITGSSISVTAQTVLSPQTLEIFIKDDISFNVLSIPQAALDYDVKYKDAWSSTGYTRNWSMG